MSLPHYSAALYNIHITYGTKPDPTLLQRVEAFINTYAKYISGLYMIGLMLHAFKLLGGLVHIHHIRKQKNLRADGLWSQKVALLVKKLGIVKNVALYFSEHVQIPLTIGHLKPIIIFPLALINNLDNEQVEAILLHELAHIRRHDYLLNILQCIMETILCFNPFVWLISKTIRMEREYCCDDIVVDEECNNFTYAKALFIIAQQNTRNYSLAMASTGTKKYPLLNRIQRLNTMKTQDSLPKFHLLIVVVVATIGVLLAWGIPQYSIAKTNRHQVHKAVIYPLNKVTLVRINKTKTFVIKTNKKKLTIYTDTVVNTNFNDTLINTAKRKFKIVIEDDKGNKKEYNSLEELPAQDKDEFLRENPSLESLGVTQRLNDTDNFAALEKFEVSPQWKNQVLAMNKAVTKINLQFKNNPQFKKQMLDLKLVNEKMAKKFNSPEWKRQMENMKLKMEKMQNSPEWKKQTEEMRLQMEKMRNNPEMQKQIEDMKKYGDEMRKHFDSPEFKREQEELTKQITDEVNNPAMQKLQHEIKHHILNEENAAEYKKFQKDMLNQVQMDRNSPEWKKMQAEIEQDTKQIQKQISGPEWQKQMEDLQKSVDDEIRVKVENAAQDTIKN